MLQVERWPLSAGPLSFLLCLGQPSLFYFSSVPFSAVGSSAPSPPYALRPAPSAAGSSLRTSGGRESQVRSCGRLETTAGDLTPLWAAGRKAHPLPGRFHDPPRDLGGLSGDSHFSLEQQTSREGPNFGHLTGEMRGGVIRDSNGVAYVGRYRRSSPFSSLGHTELRSLPQGVLGRGRSTVQP